MGHILLDSTNLAYQPTTKSREQSGYQKRHVTFAEDWPIQLKHQTRMKIKMSVIGHLCDQHQGRNLRKKRVTLILMTKIAYLWFLRDRRQLHQCEKGKDPSMAGSSCYTGTVVTT